MAKIYYDKDADLNVYKGRKIAIVGYGIQGRGQALSLRDSGLDVVVAQRPGGVNFDIAKEDGFEPVSAKEATQVSDVIMILTQDHVQADLYANDIAPYLNKGKSIAFSHGFNVHFGYIKAPKDVDVWMIAPKGPGALVRRQFLEGKGVPCLVAIHQNASKKALANALAYAKGIGGGRSGIFKTTFKEETETDLFGEQAVLCGGTSELIKAGYETLIEAGYAPEMAYFECLHELKLIVDLIFEEGIDGMRARVSDTAEYGDYSRGSRIVNKQTRKEMAKILKEIQTGKFAKEWMKENREGKRKAINQYRKEAKKHPIEKVGKRLRGFMNWMK